MYTRHYPSERAALAAVDDDSRHREKCRRRAKTVHLGDLAAIGHGDPERMGSNPKTGEPIPIAAGRRVRFKPSKALLNGVRYERRRPSPQTRRHPGTRLPQTQDDAVVAIAEIGVHQRERTRIETLMNDELARIREAGEKESRRGHIKALQKPCKTGEAKSVSS